MWVPRTPTLSPRIYHSAPDPRAQQGLTLALSGPNRPGLTGAFLNPLTGVTFFVLFGEGVGVISEVLWLYMRL